VFYALKLLRPGLLKPLLDGFVGFLIAFCAWDVSFLVNDAGGDRLLSSHRIDCNDAPQQLARTYRLYLTEQACTQQVYTSLTGIAVEGLT